MIAFALGLALVLGLIVAGSGLLALFVDIIIVVCLALVAWYLIQRFSPDPILTKIFGIVLFLLVFLVVVSDIFPSISLR